MLAALSIRRLLAGTCLLMALCPTTPAERARRGSLEAVEWESEAFEGKRRAQVYLPAGYEPEGSRYYPSLYVLAERATDLDRSDLRNALDNLIDRSVAPVIAVHVAPGEETEAYLGMLTKELVPLIDRRYRTIAEPAARAVTGAGGAGRAALLAGFRHPGTFGRIGSRSPLIDTGDLEPLLAGTHEKPLVIYMDWEDPPRNGQAVWTLLQARGHHLAGGEKSGGLDEMLSALFPL